MIGSELKQLAADTAASARGTPGAHYLAPLTALAARYRDDQPVELGEAFAVILDAYEALLIDVALEQISQGSDQAAEASRGFLRRRHDMNTARPTGAEPEPVTAHDRHHAKQ